MRRLRRIKRKILRLHRRGRWDPAEVRALLDEADRMRPAYPAKVQRFFEEVAGSWLQALVQFKRQSKVWPIPRQRPGSRRAERTRNTGPGELLYIDAHRDDAARLAQDPSWTSSQSQPSEQSEKRSRRTKKAAVIAMLQRAEGVTLGELMRATGWQRNTVRAFLSRLRRNTGYAIEHGRNPAGERTYIVRAAGNT